MSTPHEVDQQGQQVPPVGEHWPWPVPGDEQSTAFAPAPEPEPEVTGRQHRAPRRARRSASFAVVGLVGVLALLLGTITGLVLAPRFGIETAAEPAPGGDPVPVATVPSTLATTDPATSAPPAGVVADVSAIAAQALPSTVSLEVVTPEGAGTGSGFVLREDGYILTNAHVVAGGEAAGAVVTVILSDGAELPGEIVGTTADYDLAVVRVDRTGLVPLVLGDSDGVVVGQPVVAVGAPLGLQGTVTSGIVSALNRPVQTGDSEQSSFMNAIQTDAAINPGNSGGPLLDATGKVIGINSAIAQAQGQSAAGSIGLGFAIPSNQARRTAEQLIANGFATYPIAGVLLDSSYTGEGVKVSEQPSDGVQPVTPGGAAEAAGIKAGDVIVALDGRPITMPDELIVAIRAHAPGDTIVLTVRAGGVDRDIEVVLGEATSQ